MSDLEKEFQETADKINVKIREAAEALKEANRLASEAGLPALMYGMCEREDDDYEYSEEEMDALEAEGEWDGESTPLARKLSLLDVSDLETQICVAGWSTSSAYC